MKKRWKELLSPKRFRTPSPRKTIDGRNEFESDFSRIVFSSPFRRLQDKTQVFPLDSSDFIRTRLTHSMEVSTIGRGLGMSVEQELIKAGHMDSKHRTEISSVLGTAGLIHDIGNPPFGHFGETAIQHFFADYFHNNPKIACQLSDEEKADFTQFDGNVQSFRLLKKLQYLQDEHSYNLTFTTLSSIIKYPKSSIEGNRRSASVSFKKFGYFQSEKDVFEEINATLNLNNKRHPLAFLLEAADDIAYSIADIEDGCKKTILTYDIIHETLSNSLSKGTRLEKEVVQQLERLTANVDVDYPNSLDVVIQRFRIYVQGIMMEMAVKAFIENHDKIVNGEFDDELLCVSEAKNVHKAFKQLAKVIVENSKILEAELLGEKILRELLTKFTEATLSENRSNSKTKEGKLYNLISDNYRYLGDHADYHNQVYNRIMLVTDYICGMTDSFALNFYKKLSGINS